MPMDMAPTRAADVPNVVSTILAPVPSGAARRFALGIRKFVYFVCGPLTDLWPPSSGSERILYADGGCEVMRARVRSRMRMFWDGLEEGVGEDGPRQEEGGEISRHTRQVRCAPWLSQPPEFVVQSWVGMS